jgi:vacuolar-type H+-ATPase subunit I/STV1
MKMKSWVLWLLVVAFLASEVFLFSANRQKDAALTSLNAAKQQAQQLQTHLDQLRTSDADSQSAEVSRLRAENQDLPRLRNQVTQLQAVNQQLSQQLKTTLTAAQQQQEQLQQVQTENQQVRAAAQADADAQVIAERNHCINNLRQIDAAKNQWALENNKVIGAIPVEEDLLPYFQSGVFPVCPSGGTYTIGAVGVPPTCSVPGHVLP